LLEVLDPEQNANFLDHYLDVNVDLSKVIITLLVVDLYYDDKLKLDDILFFFQNLEMIQNFLEHLRLVQEILL
jgi:hypothetical protein